MNLFKEGMNSLMNLKHFNCEEHSFDKCMKKTKERERRKRLQLSNVHMRIVLHKLKSARFHARNNKREDTQRNLKSERALKQDMHKN